MTAIRKLYASASTIVAKHEPKHVIFEVVIAVAAIHVDDIVVHGARICIEIFAR